jgi:hypothetical protein
MWQCICRDLVVGRHWDRSKEVYLEDVRCLRAGLKKKLSEL